MIDWGLSQKFKFASEHPVLWNFEIGIPIIFSGKKTRHIEHCLDYADNKQLYYFLCPGPQTPDGNQIEQGFLKGYVCQNGEFSNIWTLQKILITTDWIFCIVGNLPQKILAVVGSGIEQSKKKRIKNKETLKF